MQRLGLAGPADVAVPEVQMVPASAMGTTGGFHALVPGTATPLPRKQRSASAIQLPYLVARLLSRILMVVSAIQLPHLVARLLSRILMVVSATQLPHLVARLSSLAMV
ncbi:hypothetical protein E2C01_062557 [Portunus trituberculatus]|uniref:Uncharacterized protein n=1 Tax=Portunus trituberculatus TaxID=210409 RepID=A0A5B7HEC8_PORTR|nr:hypothetical protein [Portunus trituberculatus]